MILNIRWLTVISRIFILGYVTPQQRYRCCFPQPRQTGLGWVGLSQIGIRLCTYCDIVLVSLFWRHIKLRGLFYAKAVLVEVQQPIAGQDKRVHAFLMNIYQKMNVIPWLEFKHGYYDVIVPYANHYNADTHPKVLRLVGWFYGFSTLFGLFNAELSHFDKSFTQLSLAWIQFFVYTQLNVETALFHTI